MFIQGAAATPVELCRGMTEYGVSKGVQNVRLFHMHLEGNAPFAEKGVESKCDIILCCIHDQNILRFFISQKNEMFQKILGQSVSLSVEMCAKL